MRDAARVTAEDGYARLRDAIVTGRLQPNERLVEADLSEALGLGRTAIRTALVRLEQERLVERRPNRGAKVRLVSEQEAIEILEARAVLESLSAAKAAGQATATDVRELRGVVEKMRALLDGDDPLGASEQNAVFHRWIVDIARHETSRRLIESLHSQMVRFQYRTILVPGRAERSFGEHTAIADAIEAHDAGAAEQAMRGHLGHVIEALQART